MEILVYNIIPILQSLYHNELIPPGLIKKQSVNENSDLKKAKISVSTVKDMEYLISNKFIESDSSIHFSEPPPTPEPYPTPDPQPQPTPEPVPEPTPNPEPNPEPEPYQ